MKIIATTGHVLSRYDSVHALLVMAGMATAQPVAASGMCFQRFHEKVLQVYGAEATQDSDVQLIMPGKFWQQLASDLFLANTDHAVWGWAEPDTSWVLDFWADFDPGIRFVLVYDSPEISALRFLENAPTPEAPERMLSAWLAYNARLLRFYFQQPDRCLLVQASVALANPAAFLDLVAEKLHIGLDASGVAPQVERFACPRLSRQFAQGLVAGRPDVQALLHELQASADLMEEESGRSASPVEGWEEWAGFRIGMKAEIQRLADERDAAAERVRLHQEEVLQLDRELARREMAKAELQKQVESLNAVVHNLQNKSNDWSRIEALYQENLAKSNKIQNENGSLVKKIALMQHELGLYLVAVQDKHAVQIQQVQGREDALAREKAVLVNERNHLKKQLADRDERLRGLTTDQAGAHDRLVAQLDQAQRRADNLATFWRRYHPIELIVDLRGPIDGDNWYAAEESGRWSGPGETSCIRLPGLRPGHYLVELDISAVAGADLVTGLVCACNDVKQALVAQDTGEGWLVSFELDTSTLGPGLLLECKLTLPRLPQPDAKAADTRVRGLCLRTLRLVMLEDIVQQAPEHGAIEETSPCFSQ